MKSRLKTLLASASVLLLLGAGCTANVRQEATVPAADESAGADGMMKDDGSMKTGDELDASVDAAIDAALNDADAEVSASADASADVDVINNDGAELDAYGKAYDKNEL